MITPKTPSSSALVSAEAALALEGLALSFFWAFAATDLVAAALRLGGIPSERTGENLILYLVVRRTCEIHQPPSRHRREIPHQGLCCP